MDLIQRWAGLLAVAAGFTASAADAPLLTPPAGGRYTSHFPTAPDNGLMMFPHVTVVAQPVQPQAAAQSAGFKAYKDPVTGQLTSPTADRAAELEAVISSGRFATRLRTTPPKPIYVPGGGVGVVLDESAIHYATARKTSTAPGEQK